MPLGGRRLQFSVLIGIAAAMPSGDARARPDLISSDGFDCRAFYLDADGDGYGADADVLVTCTPPQGYVPKGGDCDDNTSKIDPDESDEPDTSFIDKNCDGIDGDESIARFAAQNGSGVACTKAAPCFLEVAIGKVTPEFPHVYLQAGSYASAGGLFISNNARIYGGYDATWARADLADPNHRATVSGAFTSRGTRNAIVVVGQNAKLANIAVVTGNALATYGSLGGGGATSQGITCVDSTLALSGLDITQGNGAAGVAGSNGSPAFATAAPGGDNGGSAGTSICDDTTQRPGGAGGATSCSTGSSRGGTGGTGGKADTECDPFDGFNGTATAGTNGESAPDVGGLTGGFRGSGGTGSSTCGVAGNGQPGDFSDGARGIGGSASRIQTTFDDQHLWTGMNGTDGGLGLCGSGGGGGGGSGGCDNGIPGSYGAGGGGGGAGGNRAFLFGRGGTSGGSSFGVFGYNCTLAITLTDFHRGQGGKGGDGGDGGLGQPGGDGGPGGFAAGLGVQGGDGGDGGRGGHSGGGGGGGGGLSFGVYRFGGSLTQSGNTFDGGAGGQGGGGGIGGNAATTGTDGSDGTLGTTGICLLETDC